jgi:hypothetical protein
MQAAAVTEYAFHPDGRRINRVQRALFMDFLSHKNQTRFSAR